METPKLQEQMGSENLSSTSEVDEFQEKAAQKISVSHQINNGLINHTGEKAAERSFIVDIERFASHLTTTTDKDINANSRNTLQRSLSRKWSQQRGAEKKFSNGITINNERDYGSMAISPRASLLQQGGCTPEKSMVVSVGATEHSINPQVQNPITIMTGSLGATSAESKNSTANRRFSFRRSPPSSWTIDPRRILFFFATLSSIGTILLIVFTLSMNKSNVDDNGLN